MKSKHIATIGLLALGLAAASVQGQTPPPAAPATPTAEKAAFTDAQLVEEFGWFIGKRVGLTELAFTKEELEILIKGMRSAADGKDSPYELEKIGPSMDEFMQKRQQAYMGKMKEKNDAANAAYFTKLKENKAIVGLPSGLHYEVTQEGTGPNPTANDKVKVHYTGKLLDGSVFDSSVQRGQPAEFGLGEVIPGWTEGLQKVKKGGKITLYVPPDLAYGAEGRPGIPPSSTLVFEVELLDILASTTPAPALPALPTQPAKK
ncbi:MAG: FKBP-type peptidyl-prolyl cis-trans isomerase [Verrucomicrobiota bacterium]